MYYTDPNMVSYIDTIKPMISIFDLIDNPVEEFDCWQKSLQESIKQSNIVIYSAKYLKQVIKENVPNKECYYIGNGCDFSNFNAAKKRIQPKPKEIVNRGNKVIGYYGSISSWMDQTLVKKIADMDNVHVVMIGGLKNCSRYNMKFHHHNITWIDHVPYKDLPRYLSWFDICMIPFKNTEMMKGCNPIKLYEYCAAGKLIVSAPLTGISSNYYEINTETCQDVIEKILKNCNTRIPNKSNIKFAQKNSWTSWVNKLG